jgi:hypothetical protein
MTIAHPKQGTVFDSFVIIDWSAANQPKTGADSIWVCCKRPMGEALFNPATRHAAAALLADLLGDIIATGERVLLGCDFPFGYPSGFARRLGLTGPEWRAVWDEIARLIEDDPRNRNNRFTVAAELNRRVVEEAAPFWGCPAAHIGPYLGRKHHRRHDEIGLAERRIIDTYVPSTQPCWKLLGTGSVGGQALTGIPVMRLLRDDPRWRHTASVWPFETGLCAPASAQLVMAEVYPSLWRVSPGPNEPKDAAQVRDVARFLAARDAAAELTRFFDADPNLTPGQRSTVETEEAWTFGVVSPRPVRIAAATG